MVKLTRVSISMETLSDVLGRESVEMIPGFINEVRCPRCGGNIYIDVGNYGWYQQCLQRSYTRDMDTIVEFKEKVSEEKTFQTSYSWKSPPLPQRKRGMGVMALKVLNT